MKHNLVPVNDWSLYAGTKQRREPMYAYAYEGALSAFAVAKPSFAPLFALPPTFRPQS